MLLARESRPLTSMAQHVASPQPEDLARSVIDTAARGFVLRPFVPAALPLDTFDGSAWLAVTPFTIRGLRLRGLTAVPGLSSFRDGKPGVFFFSLDADSLIGVHIARLWFRLPYFYATNGHDRAESCRFRSGRHHPDGPGAHLDVEYRPVGPPSIAAPGALEWWLTERYCFYVAHDGGRVERGRDPSRAVAAAAGRGRGADEHHDAGSRHASRAAADDAALRANDRRPYLGTGRDRGGESDQPPCCLR